MGAQESRVRPSWPVGMGQKGQPAESSLHLGDIARERNAKFRRPRGLGHKRRRQLRKRTEAELKGFERRSIRKCRHRRGGPRGLVLAEEGLLQPSSKSLHTIGERWRCRRLEELLNR